MKIGRKFPGLVAGVALVLVCLPTSAARAEAEAPTVAEELAERIFDERPGGGDLVLVGDDGVRPIITVVENVESEAEAVRAIKATAADAPVVDAGWQQMGHLSAPDYTSNQWGLSVIGASTAWSRTTGSGVTVAVVDTGVVAHPDLNLLNGFSSVGAVVTPGGQDDTVGHGTHVAGIIAAKNDGSGITGVAPGATILPIKAFAGTTAPVSDVALGIIKAVDEGADVINMSFGYASLDPALDAALEHASDNGVIMVAASGNGAARDDADPSNDLSIDWPAKDPRVIGVGSVKNATPSPVISWFSDGGDTLDVVAPGSNVISTIMSLGYGYMSGTSMASPHVAGIAALLVARHPAVTPAQALSAITSTSTDLGATGFDTTYGHGLVNANAAVSAADRIFGVPVETPVIGNFTDTTKTYGDAAFALAATATVNGSAVAGSMSYLSSNTGVATVTGSGTVTIVGAGSSVMTVNFTPTDDIAHNPASATMTLTVNRKPQTITFGVVSGKQVGDQFTVNPTVNSTLSVALAPDDSSICTVSGFTVSAVAVGTCALTASQAGDSNHLPATSITRNVTISAPPAQTPVVGGLSATTKTYGDAAFTVSANATVNGSAIAGSMAYLSSNTSVATVNGSGTVTIVGAGTSVITANFTPTDNVAYNPSSATMTLTVNKKSQSISFPAIADKQVGDQFAAGPTVNSTLSVAISSGDTAVCTVSGLTVTAISAGTCPLTASQAGDGNHLVAETVTRNVTISAAAAQTPVLGGLSATTKTYGDAAFTLGVTATVNSSAVGGSMAYLSSDTGVATVNASGRVTIVGAGSSVITVNFTPTNAIAHNSATATMTLSVNKRPQAITFGAVAGKQVGDTFIVSPTVDSDLSVSLVSGDSTVCTVSGAAVAAVGVGKCVLTASQAGDRNHLAAESVVREIPIASVPARTSSPEEVPSTGEKSVATPKASRAIVDGELSLAVVGTDVVARLTGTTNAERLVLQVGDVVLGNLEPTAPKFVHGGAATKNGQKRYKLLAFNKDGELGDTLTAVITLSIPGQPRIVTMLKSRNSLRITAALPAGRNVLVIYRDNIEVARTKIDGGTRGRTDVVGVPFKRGVYRLRIIGPLGASSLSSKRSI